MSIDKKSLQKDSHRFCVAPMMGWTDRHERYFLRLISNRVRLYTEMITTQAILFGDRKRLLDFNFEENPIALQLGGSEVLQMTECARIAEDCTAAGSGGASTEVVSPQPLEHLVGVVPKVETKGVKKK